MDGGYSSAVLWSLRLGPRVFWLAVEDRVRICALEIPSATVDLGLELARQIPTGIVHINEQTVDDEPNIPFGGLGASGTGARFGGTANLEAFTDTRWVTIRGDIAPYPF